MVLITDHIIILHLVYVIIHIYNTLEKIHESQESNWSCTCVMVIFDLNTHKVDQWSSNSSQIVMNQGVNIGEVCWGNDDSMECVSKQVEVCGSLQVTINAPRRDKMGKNTHMCPLSQTHITQIKDVSPKGNKLGHTCAWLTNYSIGIGVKCLEITSSPPRKIP